MLRWWTIWGGAFLSWRGFKKLPWRVRVWRWEVFEAILFRLQRRELKQRFKAQTGVTLVELLIYIAIGGILLAILGPGLYGTTPAKANRVCLAHGYPEYRMTWDWQAYCVKRENNSDVVVPIRELR